MISLGSVEAFLEERYPIERADSEREFYDLWHRYGLNDLPPIEMAIAGALIADRLPWVFASGYQATLRNAFPALPPQGWAAFAATEDSHDPEAHPGTRLSNDGDDFYLNGNKSWVGHSKVLDHLIITVNDPGGDKYKAQGMIVARGAKGVTLTHREEPKFLKAMSQGFANFTNTPVKKNQVFKFEPIRQFGRSEAKFVTLAATAFMLARSRNDANFADRLITVASGLTALISEEKTSRQVYGALDREFQRCVDYFETSADTSAIADYTADQRMFRMYTDRIQRRVGYARSEAGLS